MLNAGWTQSGGLTAVNQKKTPPTHTNTHVQACVSPICYSQTSILDLNFRQQRLECSSGVWSGLGRAGCCNWSSILTIDTGRAHTKKEKWRARADWDKGTGRLERKKSNTTKMKEWMVDKGTKWQRGEKVKRECVCRMWRGEKKICKTLVGLKASKGVSSMSRKMQKKGREKAQEWKGEERMK